MIKDKIKTLEEVVHIAEMARRQEKKIVTANGCFDILHIGHVINLEFAKSQGDILIVGLNSDAWVKENKGPNRPINSQDNRIRVIAALECVDYAFVFDYTPLEWIPEIRPNFQVKSKDVESHPNFLPEKNKVEKCGGQVVLSPHVEGQSTSNIIAKIKKTQE